MSLQSWLREGKLKPHQTSAQEITNLFMVIDRDMADASIEQLSDDRRFATAYNAALQLATVALLASGYRPSAGHGHHWITLSSLKFTMGSAAQSRADYLNFCRSKRNLTDYDRAGFTQEEEVLELLEEIEAFYQDLKSWLKENHPTLL